MGKNHLKHLIMALLLTVSVSAQAQNTPASQMERLDRGVVALPAASGGGNFVSWRLFGTDDAENITFDVLRNGTVVMSDLKVTNYHDSRGSNSSTYQVVTKVNGVVTETTDEVKAWGSKWLKLTLDRPAKGANGGEYAPNDCSVGDVDGDGQYEIFLKWDPSNAKDNSQGGITDNVYIDCYKLDGTKLWRIDLGRNIRAGAHYTQFMVYDFDGDGRAEMMCKTAPGSKDGQGSYVNQSATDEQIKAASNTKLHRTSDGRINSGQEYLTVFDGLTGAAIHTIAYNPNRNAESELSEAAGTFNWGTNGKNDTGSYGNRGERYLAAVASIDGPDQPASAIFCRGYYTYAYVWAVSFDGQHIIPRWLHRSDTNTKYSVITYDADGNGTTAEYTAKQSTRKSGSRTMFGNGNHNLSVADTDGDGYDEIIWGSAALNHDGTLRYATGYGHGDAIHVGAMIPGREGLQVFQVHEEGSYYGWDLHDASTGEILHTEGSSGDNGRGMAAQLSAKTQEWWFSSASDRQQRSATTGNVASSASGSLNFRMYWDGTTQDALLDGNKLSKYSDSGGKFNSLVSFANIGPSSTCNSTKNTPNLMADILGDWREELILYSVTDQETYLGIYSTNIETNYLVPTLMHDHTYRMGVCWQNTAYNQPPHLGYNLAEAMMPQYIDPQWEINAWKDVSFTYTAKVRNAKGILIAASILPDGTRKVFAAPTGFTFTKNDDNSGFTLTGTPEMEGDYKFVFRLTGLANETRNDTLTVHVRSNVGISDMAVRHGGSQWTEGRRSVYNTAGRWMPDGDLHRLPKGVYIVRTETPDGVVVRKETIK